MCLKFFDLENADKDGKKDTDKARGENEDATDDVDMEDGPSRAEGLLKYDVQNFSKLKDTVYSDPVMIRNLQW